MFSKTIAAFSILALLGTGAYAMSNRNPSAKKVGVVEVTELEWHVAGEEIDCEYIITPKSVSVVQGGERC